MSGEGCSAFPALSQSYEWNVDYTLNVLIQKLYSRPNFLTVFISSSLLLHIELQEGQKETTFFFI